MVAPSTKPRLKGGRSGDRAGRSPVSGEGLMRVQRDRRLAVWEPGTR